MKKVAIVMGSDSDLPVVKKAVDVLTSFGVPLNAFEPTVPDFSFCVLIVTVFKRLQPSNADLPIFFTLEGMVTFVSAEHL